MYLTSKCCQLVHQPVSCQGRQLYLQHQIGLRTKVLAPTSLSLSPIIFIKIKFLIDLIYDFGFFAKIV